MPFYEYECSDCKFYSEVMQKISDKPLRKCPSCGKNTFKRLISAPVFRLKGSGWYETDFKSEKENKRNLAAEDKEAPSEAKAEAKAETKPDAKVEAKPDATVEPKAASGASAPKTPARAARAAPRPRSKSKSAHRRAAPARKK